MSGDGLLQIVSISYICSAQERAVRRGGSSLVSSAESLKFGLLAGFKARNELFERYGSRLVGNLDSHRRDPNEGS